MYRDLGGDPAPRRADDGPRPPGEVRQTRVGCSCSSAQHNEIYKAFKQFVTLKSFQVPMALPFFLSARSKQGREAHTGIRMENLLHLLVLIRREKRHGDARQLLQLSTVSHMDHERGCRYLGVGLVGQRNVFCDLQVVKWEKLRASEQLLCCIIIQPRAPVHQTPPAHPRSLAHSTFAAAVYPSLKQ